MDSTVPFHCPFMDSATISQEIFQAIIKPNRSLTSKDAWLQIECLFCDQVSSRTLQLKVQFHNLKKGSLSINEYVHRLKSVADALTSIGNPISEPDLVFQILSGLPPKYMSVSTSIFTRVPLPSFVEALSLLFLYESQLSSFSSSSTDNVTTAFVAKQQSSSSYGRRRGQQNNGGRHSNSGH
ncbi:uncharacterized protein LOC132057626 [Lycium ferocissimum]|uniref:uncharacterized protein LOC132057626 n=1 Tax=Lycium ferocissimum TaxID=112874 RepID=UPI0028153238|nr:uncharacterized protein LOC132057626 [Lycium ferocissimum]